MDNEIKREHTFKTMDEVVQFEKNYKIDLPEDYKQFLFNYGSGYIKDNYYYRAIENSPLTMEDGYNSVDYFYGSDIVNNMDFSEEELERKLIPIADAGGGDFLCVGVSSDYSGVYFWAHENSEELKDNLFLVQRTFTDFIESFVEHEEEEIDLDDIEIDLDDDLLND